MFDRLITVFFKVFLYSRYKRKYRLPKDFRFNGYFIRISGEGRVLAGDGCYLSYFSYVNVAEGTSVKLGNGVSIGHNVKIYTSGFSTEKFVLERQEEKINADVKIGSNVLIGSNVFVCPGVEIGDDIVVGANSVISSSIKEAGVYAGCPARLIKKYER